MSLNISNITRSTGIHSFEKKPIFVRYLTNLEQGPVCDYGTISRLRTATLVKRHSTPFRLNQLITIMYS